MQDPSAITVTVLKNQSPALPGPSTASVAERVSPLALPGVMQLPLHPRILSNAGCSQDSPRCYGCSPSRGGTGRGSEGLFPHDSVMQACFEDYLVTKSNDNLLSLYLCYLIRRCQPVFKKALVSRPHKLKNHSVE